MEQIYVDLIVGGLSGSIYAGGFYLKSRQAGEQFDGIKFGSSVVVGAVVGVGIANLGQQITENVIGNAVTMLATMGLTGIVENGLKIGYRWLTKKLGM